MVRRCFRRRARARSARRGASGPDRPAPAAGAAQPATVASQRCRGPNGRRPTASQAPSQGAQQLVDRLRRARCGGSAPWAAARRTSPDGPDRTAGPTGSASAGRPRRPAPRWRAGPARRRCPRPAPPAPVAGHRAPGRGDLALVVLPQHVERPHHHRAQAGQLEAAAAELQPRRVGGRLRRRPPVPDRSPDRPPRRPARTAAASRRAQLDRGDRRRAVAEVDHQRVARAPRSSSPHRYAIQLSTRRSRLGLVVPRVTAPTGFTRRQLRASRCTLCWAAWASGRTTSRSMLTCCGRVAHQAMQSAMSSATSGSATPA